MNKSRADTDIPDIIHTDVPKDISSKQRIPRLSFANRISASINITYCSDTIGIGHIFYVEKLKNLTDKKIKMNKENIGVKT